MAAPAPPPPQGDALDPIRCLTLAQLAQGGAWRLSLPHSHDCDMLLWITRGQGRACIDGLRRGIGPNNVIWLPQGTQVSFELGPQVFGQAVLIRAGESTLLSRAPQHLRIRDVDFQSDLAGLVDALQREGRLNAPLKDAALTTRFRLIEIWLLRMLAQLERDEDRVQMALPPARNAAQTLAQRFVQACEEEFRKGYTMADYACALGVTPTHLARVCKEVTGMSAADILTGRVLHDALRLLTQSDVPARQISDYLGFGSPAYFSRFIQKHSGQPPSAHRPHAKHAHA